MHKTFGTNNTVLQGVNLTVNKGEDLVILGRSGSGKSVTIKCIVGLITPDQGEIKVFNENVLNLKKPELNQIRVRIGFLFQSGALYDSMSVRENLAFTLQKHKQNLTPEEVETEVMEALDNVGLTPYIKTFENGLENQIHPGGRELSASDVQKILLARSIVGKPNILFLEDPVDKMDELTSNKIVDFLLSEENDWTVIVTSKNDIWKSKCSRMITIDDGKIINDIKL